MGNIEIKERQRYSIFGQRQQPRPSSRSPFRDALAPNSLLYREVSPIRYSPISRDRRSSFKDALKIDTSARKSPKPQEKEDFFPTKGRAGRRQVQEEGAVVSENKEKCEEIIKKVRNFNDFLVELKRKLRQDCSVGLKQKERSQVSLSVKLENERVELEKYKKLVERELSKTHSIENISIQNAANGEKILTIQYEDLASHLQPQQQDTIEAKFLAVNLPKKQTTLQVRPNGENRDQAELSARLMEISTNNQLLSESNDSSSKTANFDKRLKEAKILWGMLKKKTEELGVLLALEQQVEQSGEQLRDYLLLQERLIKISELHTSIESTNRHSMQVERKIQGLLA